MKLKLNRLELKLDGYNRYTFECKMVTALSDDNDYVKHIKITEEVLKILKQSTIEVPNWVDTSKLLEKE